MAEERMKPWLVKTLEPLCEADPEVLSDYVVALLENKDKTRDMIESELQDFLGEETSGFVEILMAAQENGFQDVDTYHSSVQQKNESDNDEPRHRYGGEKISEVTAIAAEAVVDKMKSEQYEGGRSRQRNEGDRRQGERRDARRPGGSIRDRLGDRDERYHPYGRRDRDHRGDRRDDRRYDHRDDRGRGDYGDRDGYPAYGYRGGYQQQYTPEKYDPARPEMDHGRMEDGRQVFADHSDDPGGRDRYARDDDDQGKRRGDRGGRGGRGGRDGGRGGRGGRGRDRDGPGGGGNRAPPQDIENPVQLYVRGIPAELNNVESLTGHFKQFGSIVNVQARPDREQAFVTFGEHAEAVAAVNHPEAVCGNRFIQVYWAKGGRAREQGGEKGPRHDRGGNDSRGPRGHQQEGQDSSTDWAEKAKARAAAAQEAREKRKEEKIEAFKAAEAAKVEAAKAKQEQMKELLEIAQKREASVKARLEKEKALMNKVLSSTGKERAEAMSELKALQAEGKAESSPAAGTKRPASEVDGSNGDSDSKKNKVDDAPAEDVNALRAKLDGLKQQAHSMGLVGQRGGRGRGRGRGGRGGFGAPAKPAAAAELTTTIAVVGMGENPSLEKARGHFQTFGAIDSVKTLGSGKMTKVLVKYTNRGQAQYAASQPHAVDGTKLVIFWHKDDEAPAAAAAAPAVAGTPQSEVEVFGSHGGSGRLEEDLDDESRGEERSWKR